MATLSCRRILKREKILEKIRKKRLLQKESPDVGLQEECSYVETNGIPIYIWCGISVCVISILRGVHILRVSREPLKLILRFLRVVACVVTCVVTCCMTFNYFSPSWKITVSGIIDFLLHQQYLPDGEVLELISIVFTLAFPSRKGTENEKEKDGIKKENSEIKNEKGEIKKEKVEMKNEKDEL